MNSFLIGPGLWKKIVYWSRKYSVVRVFNVAWITVYLLCLHIVKGIVNSTGRQKVAFAMAICMMVTSLPGNMAVLNAEEPERMEWNYEEFTDLSQYDLTCDEMEEIPDYELEVGYTEAPMYLFSLTNPDEAAWSSLQVTTSLAELYWVELVEQEDHTVVVSELDIAPETVGAHEQVYFVLVFPMDLQVGRTVETVQIDAVTSSDVEEDAPENVNIRFEIGMNVTDPNAETPEENTEIPVEDTETPEESTETPEVLPEEPAASTTPVEPETPEASVPFQEPYVLETHPHGYFLGSVFFVQGDAVFAFSKNYDSLYANRKLICSYGEDTCELEDMDGSVQWSVPENFAGAVSFGYYDNEDTYHEVLSRFLVRENQAPAINYQVANNDSQKLLIDIKEDGAVVSGINEFKIYVDGEALNEIGTAYEQQSNISSDCAVMTSINLEANLPSGKHDIEIVATDCCGNTAIETFSMEIQPNDCICVVLPTTFDLKINPMLKENQIHSQDIVICNKSAFDLDVSVSTVDLYVDKTIPENVVSRGSFQTASEGGHTLTVPEKGCNVDMTLRTCGDVEQKLPLQDGLNTLDTHFLLERGSDATDVRKLMRDSNDGHVVSPDYAIVNFKGMLYEDNEQLWKNGDLTIKVVFRFDRVAEEEP